jgi:hypothetical protein
MIEMLRILEDVTIGEITSMEANSIPLTSLDITYVFMYVND